MQKNITNVSETEQELEIILSAEEFGTEYNQELEEAGAGAWSGGRCAPRG